MPRAAYSGAQVRQQFGAGEIDVRDVAHEKDDQARRIGTLAHDCGQGIAHVIDIEIEQRSLGPDDEHVRLALVLGMAREVCEVRSSRDARDFRRRAGGRHGG